MNVGLPGIVCHDHRIHYPSLRPKSMAGTEDTLEKRVMGAGSPLLRIFIPRGRLAESGERSSVLQGGTGRRERSGDEPCVCIDVYTFQRESPVHLKWDPPRALVEWSLNGMRKSEKQTYKNMASTFGMRSTCLAARTSSRIGRVPKTKRCGRGQSGRSRTTWFQTTGPGI